MTLRCYDEVADDYAFLAFSATILSRSPHMKARSLALVLPAALAIAGCAHHQDNAASSSGTSGLAISSSPANAQQAADLHNTVCPVSGDKVQDSRLTETYNGKVYHLCCNDCVKPFKQDPAKYAKAVADDPAKYGVAGQK
jgi:YHS domain-containing protein